MACQCVKYHTPRATKTQKHRILPKSWGGTRAPENIVEVCGTTHDQVHAVLNEYVSFKGQPPKRVLQQYPDYARELALQAIHCRGYVPNLYTEAAPDEDRY